MPNIEIYSSTYCPYCVRAVNFFKTQDLTYTEFKVDELPERRVEMLTRSNGMRTVPQIFINDHHVGGCDELLALNNCGKLEPILKNNK